MEYCKLHSFTGTEQESKDCKDCQSENKQRADLFISANIAICTQCKCFIPRDLLDDNFICKNCNK